MPSSQECAGARGRGGAGRVNVTAQYLYLYRVFAALPDSRAWTCGERGVLGRPGFTLVGQRTWVGDLRTL